MSASAVAFDQPGSLLRRSARGSASSGSCSPRAHAVPMVDTTASLAATPAINAISVRQSKPAGRVTGSTHLPRRPATE